MYTKCPEGNKESPVLLLFYFLNCCGHIAIQCIILYTLLYILNISYLLFFLSAVTKKKDLLKAWFGIFLSLKVWQPELLGFLENPFPQREMYHSMPTKSRSNVCQSYSAGNEGPLGAQTKVLWRPRKPLSPQQDLTPPLPGIRSS